MSSGGDGAEGGSPGGVGSALKSETFLTAMQGAAAQSTRPVPRAVYEPPGMKRVQSLHGKVSHLVENLSGKLGLVLRKQEKDFLAAYRAHMYNVQKELQELRSKVDEAELEMRKNEKIVALQKERDWYRSEALRLDTFATNIKKDLKFMKDKLTTIEEDRDWLERQLKASKKQNKLLRAELEIRLSAAPLDDVAESVSARGQAASSASTGFLPPASSAAGSAAAAARARRSQTTTPSQGRRRQGGSVPSGVGRSRSGMGMRRSASGRSNRDRGAAGAEGSVQRENADLREHVEDLSSQVRQLKRQLGRARAATVERERQRSSFEDLFLRCIDTVKQDMQRRNPRGGLTYSPSGKAARRGPDGKPMSDDMLSLQMESENPDGRSRSDVSIDQFTKVDRQRVIEELLMHDEVLAYLYDVLFPMPGGNERVEEQGGAMQGGELLDDEDPAAATMESTMETGQQSGRASRASRWRERASGHGKGHGSSRKRGPGVAAPVSPSRARATPLGERLQLDPAVRDYLHGVAQSR